MKYRFIAAVLLASASALPAAAQDAGSFTLGPDVPQTAFAGPRAPEILAAQVLLDRSRHSPGVIDGLPGGNTKRAIRAYQRANDMTETGEISPELLSHLLAAHSGDVLRRYTLTEADVSGPFVDTPSDFEGMAGLERVGYARPSEKIAEQFHMDENFLRALNPGSDFAVAGTEIVIVNSGGKQVARPVVRIEVDKALSGLRAYAEDGSLVATYPATVGSATFPSPDGSMTVTAVAPDATYHFNPEGRDWGPDRRLTIAAGPNNPVGGVWIDLSKEGYGIHGSPDPQLIGKTASHGCVRLTNWDAKELAQAVRRGATVEFV